jgi:hypothetical protein
MFTVSYIIDSHVLTTSITNCESYNSTYKVGVSFKKGAFDIQLHDVELCDAFGTNNTLVSWGQMVYLGHSILDVGFILHLPVVSYAETQDRSWVYVRHEGCSCKRLSGTVFFNLQAGLTLQNTLVLYSTLVSYGGDATSRHSSGQSSAAPSFGPNVPGMVEELLTNTAMALMARAPRRLERRSGLCIRRTTVQHNW